MVAAKKAKPAAKKPAAKKQAVKKPAVKKSPPAKKPGAKPTTKKGAKRAKKPAKNAPPMMNVGDSMKLRPWYSPDGPGY